MIAVGMMCSGVTAEQHSLSTVASQNVTTCLEASHRHCAMCIDSHDGIAAAAACCCCSPSRLAALHSTSKPFATTPPPTACATDCECTRLSYFLHACVQDSAACMTCAWSNMWLLTVRCTEEYGCLLHEVAAMACLNAHQQGFDCHQAMARVCLQPCYSAISPAVGFQLCYSGTISAAIHSTARHQFAACHTCDCAGSLLVQVCHRQAMQQL